MLHAFDLNLAKQGLADPGFLVTGDPEDEPVETRPIHRHVRRGIEAAFRRRLVVGRRRRRRRRTLGRLAHDAMGRNAAEVLQRRSTGQRRGFASGRERSLLDGLHRRFGHVRGLGSLGFRRTGIRIGHLLGGRLARRVVLAFGGLFIGKGHAFSSFPTDHRTNESDAVRWGYRAP
jgi:hypothetical protein